MTPTRVLLVEDERIVALHLRQQLARLGYAVAAVAASGEEALRQIEAQRPDVVLMDIHIEGPIDGIETTARISPDLQIPVIYLTAYAGDTTLERACATRPYGYLLKPSVEAVFRARAARHDPDGNRAPHRRHDRARQPAAAGPARGGAHRPAGRADRPSPDGRAGVASGPEGRGSRAACQRCRP